MTGRVAQASPEPGLPRATAGGGLTSSLRLLAVLVAALNAVSPGRALAGEKTVLEPCEKGVECGKEHDKPVTPSPAEAEERRNAWTAALGGGAAGCGGFACAQSLAFVTMSLIAVPLVWISLPLVLNGDATGCLSFVCLLTPLQLALLAVGNVVGAGLALVGSWLVQSLVAKRRVTQFFPFLAATGPSVACLGVSAVLQFVVNFGALCATCWGVGCFTTMLVNEYGWPQANADYYALRRIGPIIFFSVLLLGQVGILSVVAGGNAASAAGLGAWALFTGRKLEAGEDWAPPDLVSPSDPPSKQPKKKRQKRAPRRPRLDELDEELVDEYDY